MKRFYFLSLGALLLAAPFRNSAQSDNFDSYASPTELSAAGWKLSALSPALVTTTFPPVGTGKGIRLQANPVPGAAPAVAMWYRTNIYSDFYLAIDIASWPGTDKDQALVLFARLTDDKGVLPANLNPANAQGVICNYDASQYGEDPGDRRQGQFQINRVGPGFDADTLAAAEITFVPGRPYRIIFQGQGSALTARAYDLHDLTAPLVSLEADDSTYSEGACGILAFSRADNMGTVDSTFDNYFADSKAPDESLPATAFAHPVPGTPAVIGRVPAERFKNFHKPADGLKFTVDVEGLSYSLDTTKLRLNGVEMPLTATEVPISGRRVATATLASALASNMVYSAQIEVQDTAGTKKSTNTFWFDTFSDAYLTNAAVKTIEAEDYNFDGGKFQLDPIPVSGVNTSMAQVNGNGSGYYDLQGIPEIDYHDNGTQPGSGLTAEYRSLDYVGTQQGEAEVENASGSEVLNDTQRSRYAVLNVPEYQVRRFDAGEWMNYTRVFTPTNYYVYLRVGSFGTSTIQLASVTSDPAQTNQTTKPLGTFAVPNTFMRSNYRYVPLTDASGNPVLLDLSGTNTLRLTNIGTPGEDDRKINVNYILFTPASGGTVGSLQLQTASAVTGPFQDAAGASVDLAKKTITLPLVGRAGFYRLRSTSALRISDIRISGQNALISWE